MKKSFVLISFIFFAFASFSQKAAETNVRYILIEAPCKAGFNALPETKEKTILTNIFKINFETPFEMVNAEPQLIKDFEVALDKAYPNSRNQVKDILVYMLNTEKEAMELRNRKLKLNKTLEKGVIDLKMK
ncbi:MAG: hypothetical protein HC819_19700 [Cyclobacteriaceae bacterium]|nr:hypothetical protein [Cyclobacteriaceae bacterium]